MKYIVVVISVLIIIIMGLIVFLAFCYDIQQVKRYNDSIVCQGVVLKKLGDVKIDSYGSGIRHQQERRYEKYLVKYSYNGQERQNEILTKQRKLELGDTLDVHIFPTNNNEENIMSDIHGQRLKELIIAIIGGVVLSAFCIYYIRNH